MAGDCYSVSTVCGWRDMGLPRPEVDHRYSVYCSNCGRKWSPSVGAGFSRHAGSGNCPHCGTDYRVWAAFNRLFSEWSG